MIGFHGSKASNISLWVYKKNLAMITNKKLEGPLSIFLTGTVVVLTTFLVYGYNKSLFSPLKFYSLVIGLITVHSLKNLGK